ncbi:exopolysaccharide biosynthesis protein [Ciceribacter sp. L1K22]|uniref:exopolysaccharide biosynthesis protein n=1 Tax=Ciceribacter sp. L1K22 TaxID=2820275 RepID=UPI001ABDF891|nr:exopolysaccharide biosynthesis protein [Ciceribacter sp. L1K22]MBO3759433.1 exopolysaccharide biosynthesis protein [Ciceribacter sp. L1K22]
MQDSNATDGMDETTGARRPGGLRAKLAALPGLLPKGRATLGQLLTGLGDHQTALVLAVFSLPAIIPTPGIPAGMIFGTALAILSLQMVAGSPEFALPGRLSRVGVPRNLVLGMASGGARTLARIDGWLKPRWRGLADAGALRPLGLVVFLMGVLIALPIPFGNVLPGLSVLMIALGLAERDGMAVGAGLLLAVLSVLFSIAMIAGGWYLIQSWLAG